MRVLGFDPSLESTGFGVVEEAGGRYVPVVFGVIRPTRRFALHEKLNEIRSEAEAHRHYAPDEVVVENPFFARNARTAFIPAKSGARFWWPSPPRLQVRIRPGRSRRR
jgi:crossover junction endodeoxyribonuclease RuvC